MQIIYGTGVNGLKRFFFDSLEEFSDKCLLNLLLVFGEKYFNNLSEIYSKDSDMLELLTQKRKYGNLTIKNNNCFYELNIDNVELRTEVVFIESIKRLAEENNLDVTFKVIEVEDGFQFDIYEGDDGSESIHEKHRCFY